MNWRKEGSRCWICWVTLILHIVKMFSVGSGNVQWSISGEDNKNAFIGGGYCDDEDSAVVAIQHDNENNMNAKVEDADIRLLFGPVAASKGILVVAMPKSLFQENPTTLYVTIEPYFSRMIATFPEEPFENLTLSAPESPWGLDTMYQISASLPFGNGVSYHITVLYESGGSNTTTHFDSDSDCASQNQCDVTYTPTELGVHYLRVLADKDQMTLEKELKVLVAIPLPQGKIEVPSLPTSNGYNLVQKHDRTFLFIAFESRGKKLFFSTNNSVLSKYDLRLIWTVFSARNPVRSQSTYFYIDDVVTVDYKAYSVPMLVPPLTSCSVDWGDGAVYVDESATLAVNETVVVYSVSHSYNSSSQYQIGFRCNTSHFEVNTTLTAEVQHPAIDTKVSLAEDQVVADATGAAQAVLNITHPYLNSSYTGLQVLIVFCNSSNISYTPLVLPDSNFTHVYQQRGHYVITVSLKYLEALWPPISFNFYGGFIDIYEIQRRSSVFISENITFQVVNINSNQTLTFNYDLGITNGTGVFRIGEEMKNLTVTYIETIETVTAEAYAAGDKASYPLAVTSPGCLSSIFLFEPSFRAMTSPMMVFLPDLPSVTGQIITSEDCNVTLEFNFLWELRKNMGNGNNKQWSEVTVDQPNSFRFQLSQAIMETGLYHLVLTLAMVENNITDSIYIQVELPPLVARIAGGSVRQISQSQFATLDADTESYDPLESTGLQFSWACYLVTDNNLPVYAFSLNTDFTYRSFEQCMDMLSNEGKLTLNTSSFFVSEKVLSEVTVSKDTRHAMAAVGLEIVAVDIPVILLNCRWNCGPRLVVEERLTLVPEITCPQCSQDELLSTIYSWDVRKHSTKTNTYISQEWDQAIYSSPTSSLFDCGGGWWEEAATYSISVQITVGSRPAVEVSRSLYVNYKPYGGACGVRPIEGTAAVTSFVFSASGWKDEGSNTVRQPDVDNADALSYQIYQISGLSRALVHSGATPQFPAMLLPACDSADGFCDIEIDVLDRYRGRTECIVRVKLFRAPVNISASTISDTLDVMSSPLRVAQAMQDPIRVAHTASVLSMRLENMRSSLPADTIDVTSYNVGNLASNDGLVRLIDPMTVSDPSYDKLVEVQDQYVSSISWAVSTTQRQEITDGLTQILPLAETLATVTASPSILSGKALVIASQAGSVITTLLGGATSAETLPGDMQECLAAITQSVGNVANSLAIDVLAGQPNGQQDHQATDLSQREVEYISDLQARRDRFQSESKFDNAGTIVATVEDTLSKAFQVARLMEHYDGTFNINTEKASIAVVGTTRSNLIKGNNQNDPVTALGFSVTDVHTGEMSEKLHMQVAKTENMYIHGKNSHFVTSQVVTGTVVTSSGQKKMLVSPSVIHPTGMNCSQDEQLEEIIPQFIADDASQFFYHRIERQDVHSVVCIKLRPSVSNLFYRLYAKAGSQPTDLNYDYRMTVPKSKMEVCEEICIPAGKLETAGIVYIAFRPFLDTSTTSRKKRSTTSSDSTGSVTNPLVAPYFFSSVSVTCYSWNGDQVAWLASQCQVIREVADQVKCVCQDTDQLTSALAFHVLPNSIDFSTVFSKFDVKGQAAVLGTILAIVGVFSLLSVWAHYWDRKSLVQYGVFPLKDNYAEENHFYLISVHTGLRRSAGTTSNVSFSLAGTLHETGIRQLSDGIREGFPLGSVQHFVMAVPSSLGDLETLRIWHDMSGPGRGACWYLDRVDIVELRSGCTWHFLCGEWLAPEDNSSDKLLQVCSPEDLETLKSAFFTKVKERATDDHIWVSVFIRPERSRFSRVERVWTCLCFLLLAMLTSAMFYQGAADVDREQAEPGLTLGPLRFGYQQLYFSIIGAFICTVPITAIVFLFRKARVRSDMDGAWGWEKRHTAMDFYRANMDFVDELIRSEKGHKKFVGKEKVSTEAEKKTPKSCCANMPWMVKLERQLDDLEKISLIKTDNNIPKGTWPRYWRVIAWLIVTLTALTCIFFVVLYSMEWGRDVSEKWLSSFLLSFMESMFVVDPFKVVMTSAVLAVLFRKWKVKETDELNLRVVSQVNREYGVKQKSKPPREFISFQSSLTDEEMKALSLKRIVQVMLTKTLREMAVHILFLWIVCSLCFISRTPGDFRMVDTIKTALVTSDGTGFATVQSTGEYFDWLDNVATPFLFPPTDYKGQSLVSEDRMFTAEQNLYRLGAPRLRQARMRKSECATDKVDVQECVMKYNTGEHNTHEHCLGWTDLPCPDIDQLRITSGAWYYRSSTEVWGIPISGSYTTYGGGGYISNLDINILVAKSTVQELKENSWTDRETRAVFLEFTLFCPNTNQFAYVILLAEFLESGGVVPFVSIHPFKPYRPAGWLGTYVVVCELLGVFFTALALVYIGYRFYHEGKAAFRDKWFCLDVLAVLMALLTISMFSSRLRFTNEATAKMREDMTQFVNFQHVAVWDFAYTVCLGFLVAIGWFRLLKLAGYSERTYKVYVTLKLASKVMPSFFALIFFLLLGFSGLGVLLFQTSSFHYRSFPSALKTLFTAFLGNKDFRKAGEQTLLQLASKFYHMLFGVVGVLIFSNFFLAVLADLVSVEPSQGDPLTQDEGKVFLLLWDSILQALGRKVDPVDRLRRVVKPTEQSEYKLPQTQTKNLQTLKEKGDEFIQKLKCLIKRSASSQDEDFIFNLSLAHIEEAERKKRKSSDTPAEPGEIN